MFRWKTHFLGVSPQLFQGVVFTDIFLENVDDHIAEIHKNPFCRAGPLNAERAMALVGQNAADVVRYRSSLALRVPGTQYEKICDGSQLGDMQDEDIGGLLVKNRPCYREGLGLSFRCDRCPPSRDRTELYKIPQVWATDPPSCGLGGCAV